MARADRDHEAVIYTRRLGAYTKEKYAPIINHINEHMGMKAFLIWAMKIYKYKFMDKKDR